MVITYFALKNEKNVWVVCVTRVRIFFSFFFCFVDNVKPMKRGRVPKGFLSSNTAYMLVYKKLTIDCRISAMKKIKLKKPDAEVSASGDSINLERPKADTSDETKRKNGIEEATSDHEGSPEKISKLDLEDKMETDESPVSENTDSPAADENKTVETVVNTDECKDKNDIVSQQLQNKILCLKKPMVKVVKLDYKRLNGAAHRAMSCGERDFYEEVNFFDVSDVCASAKYSNLTNKMFLFFFSQMEFENWQVSSTMRELVRQENVKHELSLLAAQQEKVRNYCLQSHVLNHFIIELSFTLIICYIILFFLF